MPKSGHLLPLTHTLASNTEHLPRGPLPAPWCSSVLLSPAIPCCWSSLTHAWVGSLVLKEQRDTQVSPQEAVLGSWLPGYSHYSHFYLLTHMMVTTESSGHPPIGICPTVSLISYPRGNLDSSFFFFFNRNSFFFLLYYHGYSPTGLGPNGLINFCVFCIDPFNPPYT